ncbi:hypothetical protein HOP50_04g32040 [Chloropicon primus]|uniref:Sfi1 spindle body domain-containing protein n=1 Tax=Chloropicon primus TaxID=1764295 RepID=A0A5B8MMV3_9CHLO|nr:hypothetical protein A3770_04p32000 [Chloropicon primus]UPQ99894.1 hypothetical protein HOP50_04g32040 [Chloropicon primus]|eukprot:QDZ20682.1 hypothetical protein A3770_04p32000 [Chloropicon primus]
MVVREDYSGDSPTMVVSPIRVGGGYMIPEAMDSVEKVSQDTLDLLASQDGSYTDEDFVVLSEIIQGAERSSSGSRITLTRLLKSYDRTLAGHGIDCEKDTRLYRFILKLSLDPNPDWWVKFDAECRLWSGKVSELEAGGRRTPRTPRTPRTTPSGGKSKHPTSDGDGTSKVAVSSLAGRWRRNAREKRVARQELEVREKREAEMASSVAGRWKANARNKRIEKEAVAKWERAVDFARRKRLREVLRAWYLHDLLLMSKAMNLMRSNALRYHFNLWAYSVHKFEIVCAKALEERRDKMMVKALREWQRLTRLSQMDKISALKALTYWSYNKINQCMSLWILAVKQQKKNLVHSEGIYDASLQIRAIKALKAHRELGQKAREAGAMSLRLLEARTFLKWRSKHCLAIKRKQAIAKCLEQMRAYKLKAGFCAWKRELGYKKMMRETLGYGRLRVEGVKVLYAFNAWKHWFSERIEIQGKLMAVGEMLKYRQQQNAWSAWLAYHNAKMEKEEVFLTCLSILLNQKMGRIVYSWYGRTQRELQLRRGQETLRKRIRAFNLQGAFSEWLSMVDERRDKLLRCTRALRSRRLLHAFNGFCYMVGEMKIRRLKLKLCLKRLQKRELSAAFNAWADHTHRASYVKEVLGKCTEKTILGRKMRFFSIWSTHVARLKVVKKKIMKAAQFLIEKRLTYHFERWRQLWINNLKEKLSWLESSELIEAQRLSRLFHRWMLKKRKKDLTRKVLMHWKKALLSKCLTSWSSWSKKQAIKIRLMQTLITKLKGNRCSHAFYAWMTYVRIKSKHRQIISSWRRRRLLNCFLCWKDKVLHRMYQADQLEAIIAKWRKECKWRAFAGWVSSVVSAKQKQELVRRALTFWLKQRTLKAFRVLRQNAFERKQARNALAHLFSHRQAKALCAWVYYIETKKRLRSKGLEVIRHMRDYAKKASFHTWLLYITQKERKRQMLESAVNCMKNLVLKRGFLSWTFHVEDKKTKLHNIGVCISFWKSRVKLMSLRKWKETTEYKLYVQGVLRGCVLKLHQRVAHRSLRGWVDFVCHSQEKKRNLEKALTYWRMQQISIFLFLWKDYVQQKRANEFKVAMNLKRLFFQRLYDMYLYWHFWTSKKQDQKRRLYQGVKYMRNRKLAKSFTSWRELIPWIISKRKKLRVAIAHWLLRTKLVFYLSWYDYVDKMRIVRASTRRSYVSRAMRAWKKSCRRNIVLAYILEEALMRWAYRETVKAWGRLKDNSINAKRKRKAIAHFRLSRSAMALARWMDYKEERVVMREKVGKALKLWRHACLACSFAGWLESTSYLRDQKAILRKVLGKWQKAQLRHYFDFFLQVTEEKQGLRRRAVMRMRHSCMVKCFTFWSEFAHWERAVRRAVTHWRGRAAVKMFYKWADYTDYRQAKMLGISHYESTCTWKVVKLWVEYKDRELKKKETVRRALLLFHRGLLAKGYYSWRDRVRKIVTDRRKVLKVLSLVHKRERTCCFVKWRAYVVKVHQKAIAINHARRAVKRSRLRMWASNATFLRERRSRYERLLYRVVSRMRNRLSHAVMDAWSEFAYRSKQLRRLLCIVHKRKTLRAYNTWVWYTDQQRKLRYAMARVFRRTLLRSFQGWFDRVSEKKRKLYVLQRRLGRKHELVLLIVKRMSNLPLALPWTSWQAYVNAKSYARYAMKRACHFHLSLVFNHWLKRATRLRQLREILESFALRLRLSRGQAVLKEWKELTIEHVSRREKILQKYTLAMQANVVLKVLYAWKSWCTLKNQRREKLRVALQYFTHVLVVKAFSVWRDEVNLIVQLRQIYLQRQLAIRKAIRAGEAKIRRKRWELQAATFVAWKLKASVYKRVKVYIKLKTRRVVAQSFALWKNTSIIASLRREALHRVLWGKFQAELYMFRSCYFDKWFTVWRLQKEEERMMESAARHHTIHLLSAVLQQWKLSMICADPLSAIKRTPTKFVGNATPDRVMDSVRSLSELVDRSRSERLEPFLQLTQRRRRGGDPGGSGTKTPVFGSRHHESPNSDDEGSSTFPILNMQSMYTTPVMNQRQSSRTTPPVPKSSVRSVKEYFMADDNMWF